MTKSDNKILIIMGCDLDWWQKDDFDFFSYRNRENFGGVKSVIIFIKIKFKATNVNFHSFGFTTYCLWEPMDHPAYNALAT